MKIRAAVLVTSDRRSRGEGQDESGEMAVRLLGGVAEILEKRIVPDEPEQIREVILAWWDKGVDLVLTIGGTGLGPRDVTAVVTRSLIEKEAGGITTALLIQGLQTTPRAMLTGAVAGVRGRTLIINLPGSPAAVELYVKYLLDVLPHAVDMIRGGKHD